MYDAFDSVGPNALPWPENALPWPDWISLACTALEFQPDLVLELGRGMGTSTALFQFFGFPVISTCRTRNWLDQTMPALASIHAIDWGTNVTAIVGEIADQDYEALTQGANRVLLFWDAHGYEIADTVLAKILPMLAGREVLVACHDLRDSRYFHNDREYDGKALWRRQEEPDSLFVRLGNIHSTFEQLISIVDFTSRNAIELCSPTHSIISDPALRSALPDPQWPYCYWHYFMLPTDRLMTFPRPRR